MNHICSKFTENPVAHRFTYHLLESTIDSCLLLLSSTRWSNWVAFMGHIIKKLSLMSLNSWWHLVLTLGDKHGVKMAKRLLKKLQMLSVLISSLGSIRYEWNAELWFFKVLSCFTMFWDRVSLYSLGWSWTHNPPSSPFQVLGLQVCTNTLGLVL
jgi:hypothetical protein